MQEEPLDLTDNCEQKALFSPASNLSYSQAFQMLWENGIKEITWDTRINENYEAWKYIYAN